MLAIYDISNKLTFDLLTLKVVSESRVTWATSMPILVFLGLSILELRLVYATDVRQTDVRQKHRLMLPPYGGGGITKAESGSSGNSIGPPYGRLTFICWPVFCGSC